MKPFQMDGVTYTPQMITEIRTELIKYRDESMGQWPEAIPFTVAMTHVISLLSYVINETEE